MSDFIYDGWAVCLVKRVKDLEPFAATWVKARQNPDKPSAWWFYRPRHIYKSGGGGVHYKLLPETFISKGDWETRYHA